VLGVPSSPADGPRVPEAGDGPANLPRRLWTSVLVAGLLTWVLVGVSLGILAAVGAPVPPGVGDARSVRPWVPQDAWSVLADLGWLLLVSTVVATALRSALLRRGARPTSSLPDLTAVVAVAVLIAMVAWPAAYPEVSPRLTWFGALLLTILLLRAREVWHPRDVVGPWGPRRWIATGVVLLALVAPYAAWHPLRVDHVEVSATGGTAVIQGGDVEDGSTNSASDGDGFRRAWTDGESVHVRIGPGRTVTLRFSVLADTGGVRLLSAAPIVPGGDLRVLPERPPSPDRGWSDGAPLPRRVPHRETTVRTFRLRAAARCTGRHQRIDRLRVRYDRHGATISTDLATDAPIVLVCRAGG
jgi:hypothetical protein